MTPAERMTALIRKPTPMTPEEADELWCLIADEATEEAAARFGRFGDWNWREIAYLLDELEAGVNAETGAKPSNNFEGAEADLAAPSLSLARAFVTQGDYPCTVRNAFKHLGDFARAALDNAFVRSNWPDFEDGAWTEYRPVILALEAIEQAAANIAAPEPQPAA
ncbi:MAG: hypothetical protein GC147_04615 [Porphyrobacter sp.]|nr:hypothetical protein [Porphyrobacter sp.]